MPCPTTPAPQTGGSRLSDGHRRRRRRGRVGGTWPPPAAATAAAAAAGGNAVPPPHSPSHVPARGWGEGGSLEECAHSTCGGNEATSSGGEGRVRVSGFPPPPSLFYPTPSRPTRSSLPPHPKLPLAASARVERTRRSPAAGRRPGAFLPPLLLAYDGSYKSTAVAPPRGKATISATPRPAHPRLCAPRYRCCRRCCSPSTACGGASPSSCPSPAGALRARTPPPSPRKGIPPAPSVLGRRYHPPPVGVSPSFPLPRRRDPFGSQHALVLTPPRSLSPPGPPRPQPATTRPPWHPAAPYGW